MYSVAYIYKDQINIYTSAEQGDTFTGWKSLDNSVKDFPSSYK